jgi:hypothetical protein
VDLDAVHFQRPVCETIQRHCRHLTSPFGSPERLKLAVDNS